MVTLKPEVETDRAIPLIEKYRENLLSLGHGPKTVRVIVDDVFRFVRWLNSRGLPYDRVNLDAVTAYVTHLRGRKVKRLGKIEPMKSSTIRVKVSRPKRWYDFLRKRDYIYHNPFEGLDRIRRERKLPDFLTEEEISGLLNSIKGLRERLLCETFYATGARVSEVSGINLNDVDQATGKVLLHGKGSKERLMPMTPAALLALKHYLPIRSRILKNKRHERELALFVTGGGRRWTPGGIRQRLIRLGRVGGLKKHLHPHMFRHSFATHLLNGGATLKEVQELMDHADLSTTGIYLHVTEGQKEAAHRKAHPRSGATAPDPLSLQVDERGIPTVDGELWSAIEPLFPKGNLGQGRHSGRPQLPALNVLRGLLFVLRTGIPWDCLHPGLGCGNGRVVQRRLHEWQEIGAWPKVQAVLEARLPGASGLDWSRVHSATPAKAG